MGKGGEPLLCLTVLGGVHGLAETGVASHQPWKGRLVRKGGCEFVLEARTDPGGSRSTGELTGGM